MDRLSDCGAYWESLGGVWGGRPTRAGSGYDPVHFEYPGWRAFVNWQAPDPREQINIAHELKDITGQFNPYGPVGQVVSPFEIVDAPARVYRVLTGQESYWEAVLEPFQALKNLF